MTLLIPALSRHLVIDLFDSDEDWNAVWHAKLGSQEFFVEGRLGDTFWEIAEKVRAEYESD